MASATKQIVRLLKWLDPTFVLLIILILMIAFVPFAHAIDSTAEWTIAIGSEMTEHPDRKYLEVAIQSQRQRFVNLKGSLGLWSTKAQVCGAILLGSTQWRPDLGLCYGSADIRLSTKWRYRLGIWYSMSRKWDIGFLHFSNGRRWIPKLGLEHIVPHGGRDTENYGLKFLVGQHRW